MIPKPRQPTINVLPPKLKHHCAESLFKFGKIQRCHEYVNATLRITNALNIHDRDPCQFPFLKDLCSSSVIVSAVIPPTQPCGYGQSCLELCRVEWFLCLYLV